MCSPVALASFAISAASQALSFKSQEAQAEAQMTAWQQSVQAAGKSLSDQMAQENVRLQQEQAVGVDKQLELRREALRSKGTTLASGESGGLSEELLLADVDRQQATYSAAVANNMKNQAQQSYWNKRGMVSEAASRANANKPTSTTSGSLGLGLGILGSGISAYNDFHIKKTQGDIASALGVK